MKYKFLFLVLLIIIINITFCTSGKIIIEEDENLSSNDITEQEENDEIKNDNPTSQDNKETQSNNEKEKENDKESSFSENDKENKLKEINQNNNEKKDNNKKNNNTENNENEETINKENQNDKLIENDIIYENDFNFQISIPAKWQANLKNDFEWYFNFSENINGNQIDKNLFVIVQDSDFSIKTLHNRLKQDLKNRDISIIWRDESFSFNELENLKVDVGFKSFGNGENIEFKNYFSIYSFSKDSVKLIIFFVLSIEKNEIDYKKIIENNKVIINKIIESIKFI